MAASDKPCNPSPENPKAKSSGRRRCSCCPYGYHIDLDFVRYCESITNSQLMTTATPRRTKWNTMKRKRASREALLGLEDYSKMVHESAQTKASQDVGDDLQKAVLDFEKALLHSSLPRGAHIHAKKDWQDLDKNTTTNSLDRIQFRNVNCVTRTPSIAQQRLLNDISPKAHNDSAFTNSNEANNASAETLQAIRTQMAASLQRMKELEEEIKTIPNLQNLIHRLEQENYELKKSAQQKKVSDAELKKRTNCLDVATSTNDFCHTRTLGVGCTVLTRDVGSSMVVRTVKSTGTDPIPQSQNTSVRLDLSSIQTQQEKPQENPISLNKIIGTPTVFKFKNAETSTDLHYRDIFVKNDYKTMQEPPNSIVKCNEIATMTDPSISQLFTSADMENKIKLQLLKNAPQLQSIATSTNLTQDEIFTYKEIEAEVERQVDIHEKNILNAALSRKALMTSIGIQADHKFVPDKINMGIQAKCKMFDCAVLAKPRNCEIATQVLSSVRHIGVSDDTTTFFCPRCIVNKVHASTNTVTANVKPILPHENLDHLKKKIFGSKETDTNDLIIKKDTGQNTTKMKSVSRALDTCDLPPIKSIPQSLQKSQVPIKRPSYLPISIGQQNNNKPVSSPQPIPKLRNEESNSDSGSDDGTYTVVQDTSVNSSKFDAFLTQAPLPRTYKKREPSKEMRGAMKVLNDALQQSPSGDFPKHMKTAVNIVQQEWFKISSIATSNPLDVEDYLDCFEEISSTLLEYIVNMTDVTGNTAMHYAVSNGNFDVVSILLDSKVCNINKLNTAGYTCIMLVALTKVKSETDREVVRRLFHMADVNIRAKEHGQTALMLAVSHGRIDTVEMLLEAGADINIQDEDGSTALMCAAEHGYIEIVKLLLAQPDCDLSITDYDGSTALAIAMDAGNREVGVLLYAQEHFSRGSSPYTSLKSKRAKSTTPTLKTSRPSTPSHSSNKKELDSSDPL